jgi:hypothetical protein
MGVLTHALKQSGKLVEAVINVYGDQIPSNETSVMCRFRNITELDHLPNMEGVDAADAIVWFEPDVDIEEGSIIKVDGEYWRIDRLIKARRLSSSAIVFLKALVRRHQLAEAS